LIGVRTEVSNRSGPELLLGQTTPLAPRVRISTPAEKDAPTTSREGQVLQGGPRRLIRREGWSPGSGAKKTSRLCRSRHRAAGCPQELALWCPVGGRSQSGWARKASSRGASPQFGDCAGVAPVIDGARVSAGLARRHRPRQEPRELTTDAARRFPLRRRTSRIR
jgi:hypothetical protein